MSQPRDEFGPTALETSNSRDDYSRLAQEHAALRRVATLVARGAAPAVVFETVAAEAALLLGSDFSLVARYETDGTLTHIASHPLELLSQLGPKTDLDGVDLASVVLRDGRPTCIDYDHAPGPVAELARELGVRCAVGAPIVVDDQTWGVMAIGWATPGHALPEAAERAAEFTELAATALANTESRHQITRLAEEQAALRRVAILVAEGVASADLFSAVSTEVARVFSPLEPLLLATVIRFGPGPECVLLGASRPYEHEPVGSRWSPKELYVSTRVLRTGRSARINLDDLTSVGGTDADVLRLRGFHHQVGSPIVVEGKLWGAMTLNSSQSLPPDVDERLEGFTELVATAVANTESRDAVARLAEEQEALRRVATLVARDVSPNEIFSAVSGEVAQLFDSSAGVDRFEQGSAVVIVGVANIDIPIGTRWELQEGMASAEVYRTGRSARVEEVDWSQVGGEVGELSHRHGTRSIVGSPIFVEGRLWGTMIVSTHQELLPADTEERLERFTDLIGTAIANAATSQARAQLAEEQAALRRVATLVAEGARPETLFSAVAEEAANVLDVALSAVVRYDIGSTATQVGAWGTENPFPAGTSWTLDESSVSALVAKTGLPARVADYADVPGAISTALARDAGVRSAVGAPILVDGELWGLMMALSTEDRPLPDDAETRLAGFTELIATAISNATARTELVESRARIVAAGDDARRRIERDLHDGTQQRLVALALAARAAAAELPPQSNDARERLASIASGLGQAVEELQELSRGIHPAVLSDAGLAPALEALALRSPIAVELRVATEERFPEPIEVATYFVASESLANAAKHSQASRIDVALQIDDTTLRLSVGDNGVGGADPGRGSGIVGLRDRVEALGGSLEIESSPGAGTRLYATLPIGGSL